METTNELIIVQIFHNGQLKARFEGAESPAKALGFLHKACGMSASWAIKYEGWVVQQFNEKGNFYWNEKNYGI